MKPKHTRIIIDRLTALECLFFGYKSTPSSLETWRDRTNSLELYEAINDAVTGKIAEEAWDKAIAEMAPDRKRPDHEVYDKSEKSFSADSETKQGNAKFAVKNKPFSMVKEYGINSTWTANDPEIINPNPDPNLYVVQAVTNVNVEYKMYDEKYYEFLKLDNVTVDLYCCVKLEWIKKHNLICAPDRGQKTKKSVIFDHGPVKRPGIMSIKEIIDTQYGGDERLYWQWDPK